MNLQKLIIELDLKSVYKFCMEFNKSNLPYHNSFHLENVCVFAILGCLHYKIPSINIRLVATASLFHDFNHPGMKNDDENIIESIKGFLNFNLEYNLFEDEEVSTIVELIKSTRYPYLNSCSNLTKLQMIIRDADILQGPFCQNYISTVVMALAKENKIQYLDFFKSQINFLNNVEFCTDWARSEWEKILPETIEKINYAIDSFK